MSDIRESSSVDKYDGSNFHLWKMHLSFIFQSRDVFPIVNGTLKKAALSTAADKLLWEKKDKQAIVAILATLDSHHKAEVINCTTSHEMWMQLQAYHDQHSDECIIALQEKYYGSKLSADESIAVYISSLKKLAKQLTDLGQPISDQQLISKIKCGLPSAYDPLLLAWDNLPVAEQTLLSFQARLVKFEHKLRDRVLLPESPLEQVFFAQGSLPVVSKPNSTQSVEKKHERAERLARQKRRSRCYRCGRRGHFGKECLQDSDSSTSVESPKRHKAHKGDFRSFRNNTAKRKRSHAHVTASAVSTHSDSSESVSSEAFCAQSSKPDSSREINFSWIADSGATEHMSDKRQWFTNFHPVQDKCWSVSIADDHLLYVRGVGDITVHATINGVIRPFKLQNVLYVPHLRRNLISISRLTEKHVAIIHVRNECKMITHDGAGRLLMTGSQADGLWKLDLISVTPSSEAHLASVASPGQSSRSTLSLHRWHTRLGHVSFRTIRDMSSRETVLGLPSFSKANPLVCTGCVHGKIHRRPFPVNPERKRVPLPGLFFHTDLVGPLQVPSLGGHSYFMTFKDDHSSFRFVFLLPDRKGILSVFKSLYKLSKKETGRSMVKLRTDNAKEFLSRDFQDFIKQKGIRHELTAPYSPEQNSVVERDNRTVVESVRSMLYQKSLPLEFWGEAVNTAVYVLNRVASRTLNGETPFTKWYGYKPDISHFKEFGSVCYAHVPKEVRAKLDSKARECLFLGYCPTSKAYRLWSMAKRKILHSRDVIFDEDTSPDFSSSAIRTTSNLDYSLLFPADSNASLTPVSPALSQSVSSEPVSMGAGVSPVPDEVESNSSSVRESVGVSPLLNRSLSFSSNASPRSSTNSPNSSSRLESDFSPGVAESSFRSSSVDMTYSESPDILNPTIRTRPLSEFYLDNTVDSHPAVASKSFVAATKAKSPQRVSVLPSEPQTFSQALKSDYKAEWEKAMLEEINSLLKNETWSLETLPPGRTTVKNKWVFRIKVKSDGTIERFKARLVAKGFTQSPGIDYTETFAPTARAESIRILLSVAGADGLILVQFDIKTAYLNSTIREIIFMDLPFGFEEWFYKHYPESRGKVCRILKGLYGLKQSARSWNSTFSAFLKAYDLLQSSADPCVFVSTTTPRLVLALWVDDGLAMCKDKALLSKMIAHLKTAFEVTVGDADVYVGLHITRDVAARRIFVDQQRFTETILTKYGFQDANTVTTPCDPNVSLSHPSAGDTDTPIPNFPYQEIVGSLLYLATYSRPDIAHAVSVVAQYASNFREIHCTAVKRILKYLRGTTDFALCYSQDSHEPHILTAFSDADYAGDINDRKSRSGSILFLNNGPVIWLSRKQPCTASSTTESEYVAASLTSKEVVWARRLLADIGFSQPNPTPLYSDNQSAIRLVQNPEFHKRTKHIDVVFHLIREFQTRGEISVSYVPTRLQLADILTKALTSENFHKLRSALNLSKKVFQQVGEVGR